MGDADTVLELVWLLFTSDRRLGQSQPTLTGFGFDDGAEPKGEPAPARKVPSFRLKLEDQRVQRTKVRIRLPDWLIGTQPEAVQLRESRQRDQCLEAGEGSSDAEVDADSERYVAIVEAPDIEPIRIGKLPSWSSPN